VISFSRVKEFGWEGLGAPFIIVFIVLPLYCAVLLSWGYSAQADKVAVYAYYMLVAGVALQVIDVLIEEGARQRS